ncbi:hypothetical protein ABZ801_12555 [Actinomadura sp. NPDC047616]|uniref:hypothetical protein n=1 Tax=Actinomadura sp. NPDC047616 TaxID=3155914 RepID=UPI0033C05EB2
MGFDKGRHAATPEQLMPRNPRREHLGALKASLETHNIRGSVVERCGFPLLRIARERTSAWTREIGCDYVQGVWWFVWADNGKVITSAERVDVAVRKIVQEMSAS